MWHYVGKWIYKFRFILTAILVLATIFMAYKAKDVKLGYEFTRAIPTDNAKYKIYQAFRKKFGEDGNLMVVGIKTDSLFTLKNFNAYNQLQSKIKTVAGVEEVTSVTNAVNLFTNAETGKLESVKIFADSNITFEKIQAGKKVLEGLPIYKGLLYNPETKAYICGIKINGDTLSRKSREPMMAAILNHVDSFEKQTGIATHSSGLPLIRTQVAVRIQQEMRFFLVGSVLLAAVILLLFFRSISAMLLSLVVVIIGVIFSLATLVLFGYNISLLTALIPPLMVVIGVPNCIYFLNKYHSAWLEKKDKKAAIETMISKMGVVTLFCNITAAIGFAVFAFTKSELLKEFGLVAGINIMGLFFISLILIPFALSLMKSPSANQLKYLQNKFITNLLLKMEHWVVNHPKYTTTVVALFVAFAAAGITKLKSQGFIVDDLPKNDKIYTDLKFFEQHFKGVMPLEITIHVPKEKEKLGDKAWRQFVHKMIEKVAVLEDSLYTDTYFGKPTSLVDGIQFAYRARSGNDTLIALDKEAWTTIKTGILQTGLTGTDGAATPSAGIQTDPITGMPIEAPKPVAPTPTIDSINKNGGLAKLLKSFVDSSKQEIRITVPMADVGTFKLNGILNDVEQKINRILDNEKTIYIDNGINKADSTKFRVELTGSTVTFLEGSKYLIDGLKESIFWAFLLIAISMVILFKSFRILICSLIPNVLPLVITAGVMGWAGVPLKPSTVLVFSMALGIAIDITIRFLVNYKQELPNNNGNELETVKQTINQTGLSIIYTSLVLIAGFVIFVFSDFGGTKALGWLTTLTLFVATLTNLLLLPVLLLIGRRKKWSSK
jgi:uncharacterized protein